MKSTALRLLVLTTAFLIYKSSFSQEAIQTLDIDLRGDWINSQATIPIINREENKVALFVMDRKEIYPRVFDKDFELLKEMDAVARPSSFNFPFVLGGMQISDEKYAIYFHGKDQFVQVSFDFSSGQVSSRQMKLPIKGELYLTAFSIDNEFYVLTSSRRTDQINTYKFDGGDNFERKEYNFAGLSKDFETYNLHKVLKKHGLIRISEYDPGNLTLTHRANKLFINNSEIIITLDEEQGFTRLLSLKVQDGSSYYRKYSQYMSECGLGLNENGVEVKFASSSFVYQDWIFQTGVCSSHFKLSVKDRQTGKLISQFAFEKGGDIDFKNTSIIQEGGGTVLSQNIVKELDKTKPFLRRMAASTPAIALNSYKGDSLRLTIGSYLEKEETENDDNDYFGAGVAFFKCYQPKLETLCRSVQGKPTFRFVY
ncbi:MAG: hypothetical protein AAFX87_12385 [Bacteroidota bacterium]